MMIGCRLVPFWFVIVGAALGADVDVQSVDAIEPAAVEPLHQSPVVKEWTIDFQNELGSGSRSALPADQLATIDFEKFVHDILVDDGHDEESSIDGHGVDHRSCSCCQNMEHGASVAAPSPRYNVLVDTVLQRVTQQMGPYQLDPMPLRLRRRSVRETAYLFQTSRDAKQLRNGIGAGAAVPMRVRGTLTGFSTLRRSGDVKADLVLPHGRTLLKVNVHAGPLHLNIPRDTRSVTQVSMEDLNGEMILMLHPRQGVLLHSLSFEKPALVSSSTWRSASGDQFEGPPGVKRLMPADGSTEAAVAHQLRATMRTLMKNAR